MTKLKPKINVMDQMCSLAILIKQHIQKIFKILLLLYIVVWKSNLMVILIVMIEIMT
jgi:hypothetical protein